MVSRHPHHLVHERAPKISIFIKNEVKQPLKQEQQQAQAQSQSQSQSQTQEAAEGGICGLLKKFCVG